MDQAGMVAAHGKYLGDDVFLADVLLGNVFDGDASRTGQFGSAVAYAITKRFGKSRIVEDPDLPRRKKPHHPLRIAGPGQRAGDDDPVVAGLRTRFHALTRFARSHTSSINCSAEAGLSDVGFATNGSVPS